MSSASGRDAPDRSANVKKVKVVPGGQVKQMSAALDANKQSSIAPSAPKDKSQDDANPKPVSKTAAAPSARRDTTAKPAVQASTPTKKRKHDDTSDISGSSDHMPVFKVQKNHESVEESVHRQMAMGCSHNMPVATAMPRPAPAKKAPGAAAGSQALTDAFHKRMSLQQMKDDALMVIKDRRASLNQVLLQMTTVNKSLKATEGRNAGKGPLDKSLAATKSQIEALGSEIQRLELFGSGFELWKIDGLDSRVLSALASWGLDVDRTFKADDVAAQTPSGDDKDDSDSNSADENGLFGDAPSPAQSSQATEMTGPAPAPAATPCPRPRPRPTSSIFAKKRNHVVSSISQPVQTMPVEPGKATSTAMIDAALARQAERDSMACEKKSKGKGFFASDDKPKFRYRIDANGDISMQKKYRRLLVKSASVEL